MKNLLNSIIFWSKKNKLLLMVIIFYFILRLINLTKLPIFNDESIYLDWGWRETHRSGNLYYSLYDAKQPLLMWIFGVMESIFSDPLFAGRVVSVVAGFFSLIGIYKLGKFIFTEKVALLAAFLYSIIPIFSFYDRQALMESSIAAVGIWAGYAMLRSFKDKSTRYVTILGIVLGIGFFIKSSALVFFASYVVIIFVRVFVSKKAQPLADLFYVVVIFLISTSLLLINPQFWNTLGSNSRYVLSFSELLTFPFLRWIASFWGNLQIGFYGLTPLLFITGTVGMITILLKKNILKNYFLLFFVTAFLLATVMTRISADRYLVALLPFFTIAAADLINLLIVKSKILGYGALLVILVIPLYLTLLQVFSPVKYLFLTEKLTYFTNGSYLRGYTAGYGINETVDYFKKISKSNKIEITVAENTGNPESAMIVYFGKSSNAKVVYMDSRIFGINILTSYDCLSAGIPLYFVARDNQLVGLDKYLEKIKTINNPYGPNSIGIYILKKHCQGKTLKLTPIMT